MNKILSIIVPSYNMEKYLPQCIDSLLVDRIVDIEVIIVNDGSKDGTLHIAQTYVSKHPDSIRFIDKPNGNYGSCINSGLKAATGKYIKVLDADDSFERNNINDYISFLETCEADLVISNYVIVNENGETTKSYHFSSKNVLNQTFEKTEYHRMLNGFQMHAIAYKRTVFDGLNYTQTEGVSYTDMEWMFLPMTRVKTVAYFAKTIYRYLVGRTGQTVDVSVSRKAVDQTMFVLVKMLELYSKIKGSLDTPYRKYLEHRIAMKAPSVYRICLVKQAHPALYPGLMDFDEVVKKHFPELYVSLGYEALKIIPFYYVKYWRKKYNGANPIRLLSLTNKIYRILS